MPLFYFNFQQHNHYCADEDGCVFANTEEAFLGAVDAARELWSELLVRREDPRACAFHVTDADGAELFTLPLLELLEGCAPVKVEKFVFAEPLECRARAKRAVHEAKAAVAATRSTLRETLRLLDQVKAALGQ